MSTFPEPKPQEPEDSLAAEIAPQSTDPLSPENPPAPPAEWTSDPEAPLASGNSMHAVFAPPPTAEEILREPIFAVREEPPARREERIPHLGHLGILALLALFGLIGTMTLVPIALHFHLFGISNLTQAATDYRYALGSQAAQYIITFIGCLVVFPLLWHKPYFEGIHWNAAGAFQRITRL